MSHNRKFIRGLRRPVYAVVAATVASVVTVWGAAVPAHAVACANAVACENQQTAGVQDLTDGAGNLATYTSAYGDIQGFTNTQSVVPGGTITMKVESPTKYSVEVDRLGYYGGKGSRVMSWSMNTTTGTYPADYGNTLPACDSDKSTGLVDCGNWPTTVSIQVPSTAVSGLYIVALEQTDSTDALIGYMPVPVVVREPDTAAHHSDIVVQTSDQTWQAYNTFGGQDVYVGNGPAPDGRAYRVSYNRPLPDIGQNGVFGSEFALIYWLEENGYDVSYISGIDATADAASVSNHKVFISSGHDEYWNQAQWNNVMAARHAGQNQIFMSGNEVFWRTRFENSIDGTNTPNRTMTTYKMTKLYGTTPVDGVPDPSGQWTGTWMDAHGLGTGAAPEDQLTGTLFSVTPTDPIPVLASAGAARDFPEGVIAVDFGGEAVSFQIVRTLPPGAPPPAVRSAVTDADSAYVLLPARTLGAVSDATDPSVAVLTGPVGSDQIRAALVGVMTPTTVQVRAEQLARLRGDGLATSLTDVFTACSVLSAAFAILVIVLELAGTARERGKTVSFLRTMGLPARSAGTLTAVQLVPTAIAAALAGLVLGTVLPRLLGPALDLTAFTDGYVAPVRTDLRVTLFLGLALLATVALAAVLEAVLGRRRRLSGVLRLGGDGG